MTKMWLLMEDACVEPFDHCHVDGESYYCDGAWEPFINYNPPPPCPADMPADGDPCPEQTFGGLPRETCGYRCPDDTWVIATCDDTDPQNRIFEVEDCPE